MNGNQTKGDTMTQRQQKAIVRKMCATLQAGIIGHIDAGRIPEEWDGHELRELLYDNAQLFRSNIMMKNGSVRRDDYINEVIVRNL
jgi:hypothetical protein